MITIAINSKFVMYLHYFKEVSFVTIIRLIQEFLIINGAKVTRSTSAYALPLFLPRPEN